MHHITSWHFIQYISYFLAYSSPWVKWFLYSCHILIFLPYSCIWLVVVAYGIRKWCCILVNLLRFLFFWSSIHPKNKNILLPLYVFGVEIGHIGWKAKSLKIHNIFILTLNERLKPWKALTSLSKVCFSKNLLIELDLKSNLVFEMKQKIHRRW